MHIRESENAYRLTRVRMGAYLGSKQVMRYHKTELVRNNKYKIYRMHVKDQNKNQTIFIKLSN